MVKLVLCIIMLCVLFGFGCAGTSDRAREFQSANYKVYTDAVSKPVPIWKCDNCTITGNVEVYQSGTLNGQRSIQPPVEPDTAIGSVSRAIISVGSRAVDQVATVLPWKWALDAVRDMTIKGYDSSGKNTSTSFSNSYNGDYRDIGGTLDNSNRAINGSYNPIDRHDVLNPPVTVIEPTVIEPTIIEPVTVIPPVITP